MNDEVLAAIVGGVIGIVGGLLGAVVGAWFQEYLKSRGAVHLSVRTLQVPTVADESPSFSYNVQVSNRKGVGTALMDGRLEFRKSSSKDMISYVPIDKVTGYRLDVLNIPPNTSLSRDVECLISKRDVEKVLECDQVRLVGRLSSGEPCETEVDLISSVDAEHA